jgi:hypothetical protein
MLMECLVLLLLCYTSLAVVRIPTPFPQSSVLLSVIRGFGCLRSDELEKMRHCCLPVRLCAGKNCKTSERSFMLRCFIMLRKVYCNLLDGFQFLLKSDSHNGHFT